MNQFKKPLLLFCLFGIYFLINTSGVQACSFKASFYGDTMVCSGSSSNYYTVPTPAHYYRWVVSGGSIVSGAGTYSVYALWSTPGTYSIMLVDSTSGCKDSVKLKIKAGVSAYAILANSYALLSNATSSGGLYTMSTNGVTGNGAAWNKQTINMEKNFDFTFVTNQSSTGTPADGMMLVLQNSGLSAIGGTGSDLGYYSATSPTFSQSVGVEEDIYLSGTGYNDTSASHLSLVKNDNTTPLRKQVNISPNLYNGSNRKLRMVWIRDINEMDIYFDGTKEFTWKNDLVKNIFKGNPNVIFGFTAATGGLYALQTFKNDSFAYGFPYVTASSDTICSGDTATLTATAGLSYSWSTGATTRSIKVTKGGTFTVTVTDSFHCTQTSPSHSIVVITKPTSSFTISSGCVGASLSISNSSSPTSGVSYLWKFGNGDSSTAYIPSAYRYPSAGTYTVSLNVKNGGCSAKASNTVTVYDIPSGISVAKSVPFAGQFNAGDAFTPDNICVGDTNTYQFSSPKGISNSDYGTKWAIASLTFKTTGGNVCTDTAFKFPTSLKNMQFKFFPTKKYADSLLVLTLHIKRIPGNCDTLISRYIQVRPKVVSKFGFTNACLNFPILFTDSSKATGPSPVNNWTWDFGDGTPTTTAQNPQHKYTTPGSYKVVLSATNIAGCGIPVTKTVTQYPDPKTVLNAVPGCQNFPSLFGDSSTITSGTISSRTWYFGDGATSTAKSTTHIYTKSGFYNVRLVVFSSFGCKDSLVKKIRIYPKPTAIFSFKSECVGTTIYFSNTSTDSTTGTTYLWDFGDKTSSTNGAGSHIYTANGTYRVKLTATSKYGCPDTAIEFITPGVKPTVNFYHNAACTGRNITFNDSDKNAPNSIYNWNYGDGSVVFSSKATAAIHAFSKAGTYKVKLEIDGTSGCNDSETLNVTVTDLPKPDFSAADVCIGKATVFVNNSIPATGLTWKWHFGDGSKDTAIQSPVYKYSKSGSYAVKLFATNANGCTDSLTKSVNVSAIPVVNKWATSIHNYTVRFVPQDTTQTFYKWFFGTGDSSSLKKPVYTYPATVKKYAVKLVVTNAAGCSGVLSDSLSLNGTGIEPGAGGALNSVNVYPNPFEGNTTISFSLVQKSRMNISVYDLEGRVVATLMEGSLEAGTCTETLDARKYNLSEGIYLLKFICNDQVFSTRIVNMK
jgi:PKD repeat protein